MALEIVWNKEALDNIAKAIEWISQESIVQAENVEKAILDKVGPLTTHPVRHPPDKYKKNNTGEYRAFETHSYRVSYRHTKTTVRILRIRHVKQMPKHY